MKLRVFTAFSGYDSQCLALDRLRRDFPHFDYELVGWSEIDKYAIQAHNALYPQWADRNFGDISKIDWSQVPDFDLFTYSSPCQDFSNAGQQRGGEEGSGTRSSLLWECRRAIIAKKPKYLLFENVPNVLSKNHRLVYSRWDKELRTAGYTNYAKVVDAITMGVPQSRKRLFMVSIAANQPFSFPQSVVLKKRFADLLEQEVPQRYYLSDATIASFVKYSNRKQSEGCGFAFRPTTELDIAKTITSKSGNRITDNFIITRPRGYNRGAINANIAPTITSSAFAENNLLFPASSIQKTICLNSKVDGKQPSLEHRIYSAEGCSTAITTSFLPSVDTGEDRPRKLTPRECFRLMGVDDSDIDKIQAAGISDTRQYHLAGNSIVVDVLYYIIRQLFINDKDFKQ